MAQMTFLQRLAETERLVSDGATGTNLQQRGLEPGSAAETWVLEKPEEILRLHQDFAAAGADILLTCTFGATRLRLASAGMGDQTEEINRRAVRLARQAAGETGILVAGSIGPTGHMMQPYGTLPVAEAESTFAEQARLLTESGVDVLVVETQFDIQEASAAIRGVRSVSRLPLVCSFSFDRGTRTMMGVKPVEVGRDIAPLVDAVGINCGRSLEENLKALRQLHAPTDRPIWFKPNAGLPKLDVTGVPGYDLTPADMGGRVPEWIAAGASVVGGCCGTSPEHLAQIAQAVHQLNVDHAG
jgi:5-methyltetrahydrofolate--homocysteine methyltransferase